MREVIIDEQAYVSDEKIICFEKGALDFSNPKDMAFLESYAKGLFKDFPPSHGDKTVCFLMNDFTNPGGFLYSELHVSELPKATQDYIRQFCPEMFKEGA